MLLSKTLVLPRYSTAPHRVAQRRSESSGKAVMKIVGIDLYTRSESPWPRGHARPAAADRTMQRTTCSN